jgi:peptidoglycan hydrolase-like protein with peptidoglycan-binding domain
LRLHKLLLALLALFALWSGTAIAKTNRKVPKTRAESSKPGKSSSRTGAGTRRRTKAAPGHGTRRSSQQAPTRERYREIQQALAGKGYFTGEANGVWGPDSVQALRRFQREQNLNETGKLNSVSLIALSLGPKRSMAAQLNPQPSQKRPQ